MAKACRFTAPYGSREIYHDGKPSLTVSSKLDGGHHRVDDVAREIKKLLCGEKKTKSSLGAFAIKDLWPFGKKAPAKRHPMSRTVYMMKTKSGSYIPVDRPPTHAMAGARRRRKKVRR